MREYTPVSTAEDWERGRVDLLVKTYSDGTISKRFAQLQAANNITERESQTCWLLLSAPIVTLHLPSLATHPSAESVKSGMLITKLGIIAGGTGVAAALQMLRRVADSDGPFGPHCSVFLLYSSRTPLDVLMLDELRAVEKSANGRVRIKHNLTDLSRGDGSPGDWSPAALADKTRRAKGPDLSTLTTRHYHFANPWKPPVLADGPLRMGPNEEAGLRGRVTASMIVSTGMPAPAPDVRVVVCGPPQMWEDVRDSLVSVGHAHANLTELKALGASQF